MNCVLGIPPVSLSLSLCARADNLLLCCATIFLTMARFCIGQRVWSIKCWSPHKSNCLAAHLSPIFLQLSLDAS